MDLWKLLMELFGLSSSESSTIGIEDIVLP